MLVDVGTLWEPHRMSAFLMSWRETSLIVIERCLHGLLEIGSSWKWQCYSSPRLSHRRCRHCATGAAVLFVFFLLRTSACFLSAIPWRLREDQSCDVLAPHNQCRLFHQDTRHKEKNRPFKIMHAFCIRSRIFLLSSVSWDWSFDLCHFAKWFTWNSHSRLVISCCYKVRGVCWSAL